MNFDDCFIKSASVAKCLSGRGIDGEDITCGIPDIEFSKNRAAKISLKNWLTKTSPKPEYILGPVSLSRHTMINDDGVSTYVYVFGELHDQKPNCEGENSMEIQDFLMNVIDSSPVFLDVFLEIPHDTDLYEGLDSEWSYLTKIYKKLKEYIPSKSSKSIGYPRIDNTRIHGVDIRPRGESLLNRFTEYLTILARENVKITTNEINVISRYLLPLISDTELEIGQYIKKYFITDVVQKEIERLPEDLRDELLKNFEIFEPAIDEYRQNLRFLIQYKREKHILVYSLLQYIVPLSSFGVDIYLMARMFKVFNTTDQPSGPKNIIVYSGEHHANVYRNLLDEMHFTTTDLCRDEDLDGCIHLDTFEAYPLFGVENCSFV